MIVVLEGAEKAGKTTLAKAFVEHWNRHYDVPAVYYHWGPIKDDTEYSEVLKAHYEDHLTHYIWDRGWASDTVYANLLNRNRRSKYNPWLMEMLHGRATPLKFIVINDTEVMSMLHTADDLPVDASKEQGMFMSEFPKYKLLENNMTADSLYSNIRTLETSLVIASSAYKHKVYTAVPYNRRLPVMFVATKTRNNRGDRWLPFSFDRELQYLKELGSLAEDCSFMFSHEGSPTVLKDYQLVITQGGEAYKWVKYYSDLPESQIVAVNMLRPTVKEDQRIKLILKGIRKDYGRRY